MHGIEMNIDITIYKEILEAVLKSAKAFDGVSIDSQAELKEDFDTIMEDIDITQHSSTDTDGITKSTPDLLAELKVANSIKDKQQCIESIVMIRASIMDVELALSNATDSMEKLVVSIRDA